MTEFTRDEVLGIIISLSKLDGHLISEKAPKDVTDLLEQPIELLVKKLKDSSYK